MFSELRERRIGRELRTLSELCKANPSLIEIVEIAKNPSMGDSVVIKLLATPAYLFDGTISMQHEVRIAFPEYFPACPLEVFLDRPVCHPNVHPESGYICLWTKHSTENTVIEALRQIQRVITWRSKNFEAHHVMQPSVTDREPLSYDVIAPPSGFGIAMDLRKQRLS